MEPLSDILVMELWEEFASYTPQQLLEETDQVSISQPGLISFVQEFTRELDPEIKELANYMLVVIYSMFAEGYGKVIEEISFDEIMASYEHNEELIMRMDGSYDKFYENTAKVHMSAQPHVISYVVETLFQASQTDDPILRGIEEMGFIFLLMKSVIDVLNQKTDT